MRRNKPTTVKEVENWVRLYILNTYRVKYRKMKREEYGRKLSDFFDSITKGNTLYCGEDLTRLREAYKQYKKVSDEII